MIPIIFAMSAGGIRPIAFDDFQRNEIILTVLQSLLGFLLLLNLELKLHEAVILFVFWFVQFIVPSWREEMIYVYLAWCLVEIGKLLVSRSAPAAWLGLRRTFAEHLAK
jgi:hypothetical protein